jgi:hypothetical protein
MKDDEIYLISIESIGKVRFTKIMKFNTKVLIFDGFGNLEDLFRIET